MEITQNPEEITIEDHLDTLKKEHETRFLAQELERLIEEEEELEEMAAADEEMETMAQKEIEALQQQKKGVKEKIRAILQKQYQDDRYPNTIIVEIRSGAGGDEAAIFAGNLARMYRRYAQEKGWSVEKIEENRGDHGGYKEVTYQIEGKEIYKFLAFETGVHRVQRVPETEKSGRIHTSTASVAILPVREEKSIDIDENDVAVSFSRAGGKGGQNVNRRETAVQLKHKPSGVQVRCTEERTQRRNRERAWEILEAKLEQRQREKRQQKREKKRQQQIGSAERHEKIRTYNFQQDRITDHRIEESWHNIEEIMDGKLDPIIEKMTAARE